MGNRIYLDNAASNKPLQNALSYYVSIAEQYYGNPASVHKHGSDANHVLEESREIVRTFINADEEDGIYFTSGATEGNSIGIQGLLRANNFYKVMTTKMEHADILYLCDQLGYSLWEYAPAKYLSVLYNTGVLDPDLLRQEIKTYKKANSKYKPLVVVQGANSEIGIVQPLSQIADIVHEYDGVLFSDVTQLLPDRPFNVKDSGVDVCTCSSQKLGGIKGSGFLYVKNGINICPIIFGKQGLRGGTPNLPAIASFTKSLDTINEFDLWHRRFGDNPFKIVKEIMGDVEGCEIIGSGYDIDRVHNIIPIVCKKCYLDGQQIVSLLDEQKYSISSGSACSNYVPDISDTLTAIGMNNEDANKVIRISLGFNNIDYGALCDCMITLKKIIQTYS